MIALLSSCGAMGDNLFPSGVDNTATVPQGATGGNVSQTTPDLVLPDTAGGTFSLRGETAAGKTVVLYFTMWCPVCDTHQQNMQNSVMPRYPSVEYCLVDYVSGSPEAAKAAQDSAGWSSAPFKVLADLNGRAVTAFHATMGTTVVVDKTGIIRMNEDYRDGNPLLAVLEGLR